MSAMLLDVVQWPMAGAARAAIWTVSGRFGSLADGIWQRRDPRVRHQLLQSAPGAALVPLVMLIYMLLVRYGPVLMHNRKSPPLAAVMAVYNCVQVALSGYMMWEFFTSRPKHMVCSRVEVSTAPMSLRLANVCWLFHITKLLDLLDTLFLVLKKDNKRMTYLHVFHHASMFVSCWLITLFTPGGSCWISCSINCFVHCVMYVYYLLASLGPRVRPYLWWKRFLTQLQLVQFLLIALHIIACQFPGVRCGAYHWATAMTFVYLIVITGLFLNFYTQAYRSAAQREPPKLKLPRLVSNVSVSSSSISKLMVSHGLGCFQTED